MYYNTTRLTGAAYYDALQKAKKQEDIIHIMFRKVIEASPSEIEILCRGLARDWPITSIHRAITNLTEAGKLERTEEKNIGAYGRPEFIWRVKSEVHDDN